MDTLDSGAVQKEELAQVVKTIIEMLKLVQDLATNEIKEIKDQMDEFLTDAKNTSSVNADLLNELSSLFESNKKLNIGVLANEVRQELSELSSRIPKVPKMKDVWTRIAEVEAKIPTLPDEKLGEDYRNALEALPEGDKLAIEAIQDLRKELDSLKRLITANKGGGGAIAGRDLFKDIDLSASLDGVTKTFNIPVVWNIISVHTSSFPNALRKTVDFTYTPTSITFTSQIDAATTLAAGQTVVLTVVTG